MDLDWEQAPLCVAPGRVVCRQPLLGDADDTFLGWYVDILEPYRRSQIGFDTRDLVLDAVIEPDRSWQWKDEDELQWSGDNGLLAPYDPEFVRDHGDRAVMILLDEDPLLDDEWMAWRPDPSWSIPEVPDGWHRVQIQNDGRSDVSPGSNGSARGST